MYLVFYLNTSFWVFVSTLHILQSYLSDRPAIDYNLRERHHNKSLILNTADLNERDFCFGHNQLKQHACIIHYTYTNFLKV